MSQTRRWINESDQCLQQIPATYSVIISILELPSMFDSDRESIQFFFFFFLLDKIRDYLFSVIVVKHVCKNPVTQNISGSECQRNFRHFQAVNEQASISVSCT